MLFAVEGGAGCGKTTALMGSLGDTLAEMPLINGQRVLALTFMHGAKHRLHERMRRVPGLQGRFECITIDSFAWRLVRRWRSLAAAIGIGALREDEYDEQCNAAAALLERPEVLAWVIASFPIVLVDEAQDLKPERLRMIRALVPSARLLVAADEFQCLDQTLRPNPLVTWLHLACEPLVLTQVRRTDVPALLAAAASIRAGNAPVAGRHFQIMTSRGPHMAPAFLANAIAWRQGGDVAVITPSLSGGFARNTVGRVCQQSCGRQGNGPYSIHWGRSHDDDLEALIQPLAFEGLLSLPDTLQQLDGLGQSGTVRAAKSWAVHQARAAGKTAFCRDELVAVIARDILVRRQRSGAASHLFSAMTVQQAKNREFDGVVVLWPF